MRTDEFQNFLFKSAITAMACDGSIEEREISEIRNMAEKEIYFMGFDYKQPLEDNLAYIKENGKDAINGYLSELSTANLNDKQELVLVEVMLRTIESDERIEQNEIKFLQLVKSKLRTTEEAIITNFPKKMHLLIDFHNYGLHEEFTEDIKFE